MTREILMPSTLVIGKEGKQSSSAQLVAAAGPGDGIGDAVRVNVARRNGEDLLGGHRPIGSGSVWM